MPMLSPFVSIILSIATEVARTDPCQKATAEGDRYFLPKWRTEA